MSGMFARKGEEYGRVAGAREEVEKRRNPGFRRLLHLPRDQTEKSHVNKREFVVYSVDDDKAIRWDVHCPMLNSLR
jgi:hypothetical protein